MSGQRDDPGCGAPGVAKVRGHDVQPGLVHPRAELVEIKCRDSCLRRNLAMLRVSCLFM